MKAIHKFRLIKNKHKYKRFLNYWLKIIQKIPQTIKDRNNKYNKKQNNKKFKIKVFKIKQNKIHQIMFINNSKLFNISM
jgi:hypothetical protein